ncbi:LuxR C-terminal-related transcriptional regulator [Inhella gelatinilytica]|uniref:Response regulator transcription factor n=1 Tax=Inhella gelatinilytica TaxID=2795030 RepID=A0A931IZL5_9BURK|nr:response regulator transcription factor [Inhella gelatinilytica]MBH9552706.1 response regulator transcription factor [Inhella gelatinilytica]
MTMTRTSAPTATVRLLLADDHVMFREGLKLLLGLEPGWQIVAETATLETLQALVAEHQPDLLLLDYHMPGGDSAALAAWLKQRHPALRIVALTGAQSPVVLRQLVDLGLHGVLPKAGSGTDLIEALKRVLRGEHVIEPGVQRAADTTQLALTPRELQITRMICEGQSNAQMAEHLHLSPKTVDKHRENLMRKMQVSSAAQLVGKVRDLRLFE